MSDDEIMDSILGVLEAHLDEENFKRAHDWLVKRCAAYEALEDLGMLPE
jgi:hypothetical protein